MESSVTAESLPAFRYHPDPVGSKVFVPSHGTCPCCQADRSWAYVGPFYALEELDGLCPWCIANGRAHARFDAEFGEIEAIEGGADPEAVDELLHRTPWYFAAQQEPWPVHCGDFCAVVGRLRPLDLGRYREGLTSDLQAIRFRLELDPQELERYLRMENSPLWAQLFRCLRCRRYRLAADFE